MSVFNRDPLRWARTALALGLAAAFLLSRHLWLSTRFYPLTPVLPFLRPLPYPWDLALFAAAAALSLAVAILPHPRHTLSLLLLAALAMALADWSRWQPWFYQYLLLLAAIRFASPQRALAICRLVVIATYCWSGLQKLNPGFVGGLFPWLLEPVLHRLPWIAPLVPAAAFTAPILEFAIGAGLLFRRTRTAAALAAVCMHLFLLFELGPLGHNFNRVVWPWNLAMISLDLLLFFRTPQFRLAGAWSAHPDDRLGALYGKLVFALVVVAPLFSFFGLWDEYLSFALYSGNSGSGIIYMAGALSDRLPDQMQNWIALTEKTGVDKIDVNTWSFDELDVPAYDRSAVFRNAARAVCRYQESPGELTLVIDGRAQWLGRSSHAVYSCSALQP